MPGWAVELTKTLVPVIVGGLLGLAGGLIGPWLLENRKEENEKKKKRAEKFEELVSALYELDHWMDKARGIRVWKNPGELPLTPLSKIHAITAIYFPDWVERIRELEQLTRSFEIWMWKAVKERAAEKGKANEGLAEVHEPYINCLFSLHRDLRQYAKDEFGFDK